MSVVCAESDAEAQQLAASGRMAFSLLRQGRLIKIPPVEKALRYLARAFGLGMAARDPASIAAPAGAS